MITRDLGKGGPKVGAIGLGAMSFCDFYGPVNDEDSFATLARAEELGITHIDTANVYGMGKSETIIGDYIKGRAHNFVIGTKAGIWRDADGKRGFNNQPDYIRAELEKSLTRLGVDHVALFYMHRRDPSLEIETVMEHLLRLVEEGLIGGIGFSEIAPQSIRRAAAVGPVRAVQNEYSLWTRMPDLGVVQACADVGAAFVPFSPMARGMLGTRPVSKETLAHDAFRSAIPRFQSPNYERNCAILAEFRDFAEAQGTCPATLAMAWVLDQGDHMIPIPGTRNPAHLDELAAGASFAMTDEIRTGIDRILPVGWAHGDRYSAAQWIGVEQYC